MTDNKHHIVIVGGGFGGLWAVRALKQENVRITLVDKRNFHLFQPLLYQVATGGLSPADIASPIRGILSNQKNVSVLLDEMTGIDKEKRELTLKKSTLSYDSLIIATGSENFYFGNNDWMQHAPGLKSLEDAVYIRNKIFKAFEQADRETDEEIKNRLMTFVIIGGGPTGVELAGALCEIAKITLRDNFSNIDPAEARIIVVDGGDEILQEFQPKLRSKAHESLTKLGARILTKTFAQKIDKQGVLVKDEDKTYRIESANVIWAAGVIPSPIGKMLVTDESQLDKRHRVKVSNKLTLPGYDNIYIIGDLAYTEDENGNPLPGTAPVAMSQGRYTGKQIIAKLNKQSVKSYRYFDKGKMAVIGRAAAICELRWANFSGFPAWLFWLFVHLMYLVEFDNRLIVFIQWGWNYMTRNRGARLITYSSDSKENQ